MFSLWAVWLQVVLRVSAQSSTYTRDLYYDTYLDDCFGENSIYGLLNDQMDPLCDEAAGAPVNYTALTECHCESGWLSVKQACEDCSIKYGQSYLENTTSLSSDCIASGFSIGPIPKSILEAWSEHNETFVPSTTTGTRSAGTTGRLSTKTTRNGFSLTDVPTVTVESQFSWSGMPSKTFIITQNGDPTGSVPVIQRPSSTVHTSGSTRGQSRRSDPLLRTVASILLILGTPRSFMGPIWLALLTFIWTVSAQDFDDPTYRDYLHDCFSDDSICVLQMYNLYGPCEDALAGWNYTAWYQCHCESGWLEAKQACVNCKKAYGQSSSLDDMSTWSADCTESGRHFSIGPIPSAIMEAWSRHNESFTPQARVTSTEDEDSRSTATPLLKTTSSQIPKNTEKSTPGSSRSSLRPTPSFMPATSSLLTRDDSPTSSVTSAPRTTSTSSTSTGNPTCETWGIRLAWMVAAMFVFVFQYHVDDF